MFTQLFKMMWHRKGKNLLLLIEIFFSFIVLFATGTLLFKNLNNYFTPIGFDYTNVYEIAMNQHQDSLPASLAKLSQMDQLLKGRPEFSAYGFSTVNTPFAFSTWNSSISHNEKTTTADFYVVSEGYFDTYDLQLKSGRWLQEGDMGDVRQIVINQTLADLLFPDEDPVGQTLNQPNAEEQEFSYKVIGVVEHFRQDGEFGEPREAMWLYFNPQQSSFPENLDFPSKVLVEVKPGADPGWQESVMEGLGRVAGDWTLELSEVSKMRKAKGKQVFIPVIILCVVCGFLIINVALGLFGVLWYNISKRYAEIGIRRALGATQKAIRLQMVGEVLVLATLALVLGIIIAIQFPLLGVLNVASSVYLSAIAGALAVIYLLVFLCAWYPGRQAARIEPAMALHYE